jgi:hypothetical protein
VDIASGAYAPFVEDWLRVFPKEQIYFVKFEDYEKDMATTVKNIVKFLKLRKSFELEQTGSLDL